VVFEPNSWRVDQLGVGDVVLEVEPVLDHIDSSTSPVPSPAPALASLPRPRPRAALYPSDHFSKESQQPPEGFKGQQRARGYFTVGTRAVAMRRAKASLALKRELYKRRDPALDGGRRRRLAWPGRC
jgi:hypothetical protein